MRARSTLTLVFERAGFTLARMTNHAIWRCPCGHTQVTAPTTPGRGRSMDNTTAQIARTLKACEKRSAAA